MFHRAYMALIRGSLPLDSRSVYYLFCLLFELSADILFLADTSTLERNLMILPHLHFLFRLLFQAMCWTIGEHNGSNLIHGYN